MKYTLVLAALCAVSAVKLEQSVFPGSERPCITEPLEIDEETLNQQLDYFSRNFDKKHYDNAMAIYAEMKAAGKDPKVRVNTYELLDKAFAFERVRRYDLVQQHMNLVEHLQDNLNQNFTNQQNVDQFIIVAKAAEAAFNAKYHNGEFSDPADFDPYAKHPATWAGVKFWKGGIWLENLKQASLLFIYLRKDVKKS